MSDRKPANQGPTQLLPERANLEHLRNEAKQRLKAMRIDNPGATLAAAQLTTARLYGFTSWRRLVAYVKARAMRKINRANQAKTRRSPSAMD